MSSAKKSAARPCPCHSGAEYRACCAPFHRGEREAPDPVALMRSRYAAFALGDAEYLWRTLHEDHPDRAQPREPLLRSLRAAKDRLRYMGLGILDHREADGHGEVLFHATIYERGKDVSFVELSDFAHDGVGWRYLSGITLPVAQLRPRVSELRIETFLARTAGERA